MTRPAAEPGDEAAKGAADSTRRPAARKTDMVADTIEFSRPSLDADQTVVRRPEPEFRLNWRGYDRNQVDDYRARVEAELTTARTAHERAVQAHAETIDRLRAAQNDLGRLRGQLTNSPTALSERLREILQLAEQDADQTRADAQIEADQIRSRAVADAEAIMRQARDSAAEIVNDALAEQQKVKSEVEEVQAAVTRQLDEARVEADQLRDTASAELRALAAEAQQARDQADAEAAARRGEADRQAREQREQAQAAAESRLAEMSQQLTDLTRRRDEVLASASHLQRELAEILTLTGSANEPTAGPAALSETRSGQSSPSGGDPA